MLFRSARGRCYSQSDCHLKAYQEEITLYKDSWGVPSGVRGVDVTLKATLKRLPYDLSKIL